MVSFALKACLASGHRPPRTSIFGAREEDLPKLRKHYNPREAYETVSGLKRVLAFFVTATLDVSGSGDLTSNP